MKYTTQLRIVTRLDGTERRKETLHGKEYLVVSAIPLRENVVMGDGPAFSEGALLVPDSELPLVSMLLDSTPILVNHPGFMFGNELEAVKEDGIGVTYMSMYDAQKKAVTVEAWFDIEASNAHERGADILTRLNAGDIVETSLGFMHTVEMTAGVYKGEDYVGIIRDIAPLHLAALPDDIGACSIGKGCGIGRLSAGKDEPATMGKVKEYFSSKFSGLIKANNQNDNPEVVMNDTQKKAFLAKFKAAGKSDAEAKTALENFENGKLCDAGWAILLAEPKAPEKKTEPTSELAELITGAVDKAVAPFKAELEALKKSANDAEATENEALNAALKDKFSEASLKEFTVAQKREIAKNMGVGVDLKGTGVSGDSGAATGEEKKVSVNSSVDVAAVKKEEVK